jgi:hypothetical protein
MASTTSSTRSPSSATRDRLVVTPLSRRGPDLRRFLAVPYAVYAGDPCWVAPPLMDLKQVFSDANPLFEHAEMQLWVATCQGRDVGRIAGIIDRNHLAIHQDATGFFGFFESIEDPAVCIALVDTVRAWARQRNLRSVRGPMNPTPNDECGLLVDGFDSPPVLMMTYNPRYYPALLEQAGLDKARDLLAFHIDLSQTPMNRFERLAARVRSRNPSLRFRPVLKRSLSADLDKVKEVYNAAWADNWGFTPMTDAEVDFLAGRLKPLFTEGLVWLAEDGSEPVGFLLAVLDFNVALQPLRGRLLSPGLFRALPFFLGWKIPRMCRVMTLGVKDGHRGRGLESVMLYEGLQTGCRLGLTGAEASWILEDNTAMCRMLEVFGARVYKTYRIYEGPVDR